MEPCSIQIMACLSPTLAFIPNSSSITCTA